MEWWRCCGCCWRWSGAGDPTAVVRTPSRCQDLYLRSGTGRGYIESYKIGKFSEGSVHVLSINELRVQNVTANKYLSRASYKTQHFVFSIDWIRAHEDQSNSKWQMIFCVFRRLIECSECRTGSNNEDDLPLHPPRYNCVAGAAGHRRLGHLRRLWYLHWLLPELQI